MLSVAMSVTFAVCPTILKFDVPRTKRKALINALAIPVVLAVVIMYNGLSATFIAV